MKARNALQTGIIRVLIGRLQTLEANQGKALTEDQEISIVKSLIKQNNEEIADRQGHEQYIETIAKLKAENVILETYLPYFLPAEQIKATLWMPENLSQIIAAKNDRAATGVAMRILKPIGKVDGQMVSDIVTEVYANAHG